MANATGRRSFWGWGLAADEPTQADRERLARDLAGRYGVEVTARPCPTIDEVTLRGPRLVPPRPLAGYCSTEVWDRAEHTYGQAFPDRYKAFNRQFDNPPDVVAFPSNEAEVAAVMEWCDDAGAVMIPFGGGSSVVEGTNVPDDRPAVTIDLRRLDQVLEVDPVSRAARIQSGALGPAIESQLKPHGFTLRHFPQSFQWSTLGGWIATRSGGHYATNHTHIDDFVESTRMLTPAGWWESRRLPGSGAGPSPDRVVIGSEGTLGVITEAWMRVQRRPVFRASAGVTFPTWEAGWAAVRDVVQTKTWPSNLRILDPSQARADAGLDGDRSLLIIGYESSEVPQGDNIRVALDIARHHGGHVDDDAVKVTGGGDEAAARGGAVGAWRDAFIGVDLNTPVSLGLIADTFETAITWDRWPEFDAAVREQVTAALQRVCGGGRLSCRFTHVYVDGPAPYYTFVAMGRQGQELEQWAEIKQAASEAVLAAGGTVTHHHAVGRMHRPQYDRQRPDLFAAAFRAAKRVVDPKGLLNPGVLVDAI
jgi:alkyldihydroxyacetonephosphate synthase